MDKKEEVEGIISKHVAWSAGAGLIPIPLLDVLAVTAIQLDMLKQLCRIHDVDYSESSGKALLSAITSSSIAKVGASMVKAVPVIGTALGTVSMPVMSGASTYAIGNAIIWHFESGGDLLNINFKKMKEGYKKFFDKGKEVALQVHKNQKDSSSRKQTIKQLDELLKSKEKGEISEEEYEARKQELLKSL